MICFWKKYATTTGMCNRAMLGGHILSLSDLCNLIWGKNCDQVLLPHTYALHNSAKAFGYSKPCSSPDMGMDMSLTSYLELSIIPHPVCPHLITHETFECKPEAD